MLTDPNLQKTIKYLFDFPKYATEMSPVVAHKY